MYMLGSLHWSEGILGVAPPLCLIACGGWQVFALQLYARLLLHSQSVLLEALSTDATLTTGLLCERGRPGVGSCH